ncbi:hypothetical protein NKI25_35455 [Mesorhizobium sp. M0808]|uniref:hypothetical protein n=1 Tax=Mesorhizobium sp. M0808 TaxID=2957002 RepID=UPI0033383956
MSEIDIGYHSMMSVQSSLVMHLCRAYFMPFPAELPMNNAFIAYLSAELAQLKSAGFYKCDRVITSTQSSKIEVAGGSKGRCHDVAA